MFYTIDENSFAISFFTNGDSVPFQYQPSYPNGDPFDSVAEAEAWAELSIAAHDPLVQTYAPIGKGVPAEFKYEYKPETIQFEKDKASGKAKLLALGLTAEEIAALSK